MSNRDIGDRRLSNQRIDGERLQTPTEVVKWMGAMQAQDYGQSLWAIGSRMASATVGDVERAIADGKIVRTWPMRGTIHFVPAEDAKWMLKLCTPRPLASARRRAEQLGLDQETLERCEGLLVDALKGNNRLSRPDVMTLFENAGISTKGQRGYHILWHLAQSSVICHGPMEGKQQAFVLLDEWAPEARELSPEQSLAELAARYFASHGPTTVHDFAWWSGLTVKDARWGIDVVKAGFVSETVDGTEYWSKEHTGTSGALDGGRPHDDAPDVHLLAGFDEFLLGYKDRSAVLDDAHAEKVVPGKNGMFLPIIVAEGRVVGTWKRTIKPKGIDFTFNLFADRGQRDDLEERVMTEARRYADFMEMELLPAP